MKNNILHLCADIGSDSFPYLQDPRYNVVLIGEDIGVENYSADFPVHGIIANPVCTEFSTANGFHRQNNLEKGMVLVRHCQRIIRECRPAWWVLENPFNGRLKEILGPPEFVYQPWEYGSPWTKKTALWGRFRAPERLYKSWSDVPKNPLLYQRPGRGKPALAFMHKSAIHHINEFRPFINAVENDADFRSLCSQGFAREFKKFNP